MWVIWFEHILFELLTHIVFTDKNKQTYKLCLDKIYKFIRFISPSSSVGV